MSAYRWSPLKLGGCRRRASHGERCNVYTGGQFGQLIAAATVLAPTRINADAAQSAGDGPYADPDYWAWTIRTGATACGPVVDHGIAADAAGARQEAEAAILAEEIRCA